MGLSGASESSMICLYKSATYHKVKNMYVARLAVEVCSGGSERRRRCVESVGPLYPDSDLAFSRGFFSSFRGASNSSLQLGVQQASEGMIQRPWSLHFRHMGARETVVTRNLPCLLASFVHRGRIPIAEPLKDFFHRDRGLAIGYFGTYPIGYFGTVPSLSPKGAF